MQQELTACKEQAQNYYEMQDMGGLEQVMRRWEQLLGQARSMQSGTAGWQNGAEQEQDAPLWLVLSEMWFQQLNGALYEGASMLRDALECYQKAGDLAYEAFCLVEERAACEDMAEQGCECILMNCILYRTYMKCMEPGKAAEVIRVGSWMFDTLYPSFCRNLAEGTFAAEVMLDISSAQSSCGDWGGALVSQSKAEKRFQELYRISDNMFHLVMAVRVRELILLMRIQMQNQPIGEEELRAVEQQLQACSDCGQQLPEYGLVCDAKIILLVLRGFGASIQGDMRKMETCFSEAGRRIDELIPHMRTCQTEDAFLSRVNQETLARLCNYQIAVREQLGNSQKALGKLKEAAQTYEETLKLLTMPDCTFIPLEQQRMSGRLGTALGLIYLELGNRQSAEFYLNRAAAVLEEVMRTTALEADCAAFVETKRQATRLTQPQAPRKRSFLDRILGR